MSCIRALHYSIVATVVALAFAFTTSVAFANDHHSYDYDYDNYEYYSYDHSYHDSFNNYDSYNTYYDRYDYDDYDHDRHYYNDYTYTYGYPYANYSYSYPYNNYYGYSYGRPSCSISIQYNNFYGYNRSITLTWWASNATSAYLSGVGSVGTSGSQTLYSQGGSYVLTVYGPGGSDTCYVNNTYENDYGYRYHTPSNYTYAYPLYSYASYVQPTYTYPTQYVNLSQTPYTGFDFGTVGNSLYWLGMILIAAAGAYLIVYSHSGAYPRAFVREVGAAARNQVRLVRRLVK